MSVCRHIWFYIKKHTRTKTPTFGIAVVWKHRTGREKERKTFIKQHADWYWPLHVVTMQGAKHHMQVIFRDPETEEGKRWFMAGGLRLGVWPFAYEPTPESQTGLRARERLGILKVTLGKFGLARQKIKYEKLRWRCSGRRSALRIRTSSS